MRCRRSDRRRGCGRHRRVGRGRGHAADTAHARSCAGHRHDHRQPRVPGRARAPRHHRRDARPDPDRSVAGGRVRLRVRRRTPDLALHLLPARDTDRQRLRAPDRGPHRALRQRAQRSAGGQRPRHHAAPAEPGELPRRRSAPDAHRHQADRDHATRGTELHRRRQLDQLAEVAVPDRVRPVRGTRAAPGRLPRRRRPAAFDPAPRVDQRDGRPLRRSRSRARMEERVRRGRVGTRAHDATADTRLRLRRRDSLLRRHARVGDGQAVGHRERDLHARRGLRDPLEARRPVGWHERGAAKSSPGGQLRVNCRQLRIRILLVLLSRWQHPTRGQAHRHRVARWPSFRVRRRPSPT